LLLSQFLSFNKNLFVSGRINSRLQADAFIKTPYSVFYGRVAGMLYVQAVDVKRLLDRVLLSTSCM